MCYCSAVLHFHGGWVNVVENRVAGFLLGALLFLVITTAIILMRKKIIFPYIRNLIIRKAI
ncbi:MAG: hypothetical protein WDO16_21845 [Bacteroidota bacterium]